MDKDIEKHYIEAYGKPPKLVWYPDKKRQVTVERRIASLVKRKKAFYLTTTSLDQDSNEEETWYVDGGNWASKKNDGKYNILVGHIKNCLKFLNGLRPLWGNQPKKKTRTRRRR